eukprot:TRINITY_DN35895_c0_g1_i1.p1 TRINITY_DN35895_c0_g1~~TRINITY_DN35895_c0_g1_i1.p1  ORF type:complete len:129 (+),score=3.66 TRINITY_DN35895_c0_g1_i1:1509-1895(+)
MTPPVAKMYTICWIMKHSLNAIEILTTACRAALNCMADNDEMYTLTRAMEIHPGMEQFTRESCTDFHLRVSTKNNTSEVIEPDTLVPRRPDDKSLYFKAKRTLPQRYASIPNLHPAVLLPVYKTNVRA